MVGPLITIILSQIIKRKQDFDVILILIFVVVGLGYLSVINNRLAINFGNTSFGWMANGTTTVFPLAYTTNYICVTCPHTNDNFWGTSTTTVNGNTLTSFISGIYGANFNASLYYISIGY